jgi:predicted nuclease of predicted toxin-antitoxin system
VRRFLVDNQLPAALARWIGTQGCEAEHVLALDLGQSPDMAIWTRAASLGAVIVSKDEDFARFTLVRPEPVAVVWLRLGNCRTATLLATMERVWPEIVRQLDAGDRLIEVN